MTTKKRLKKATKKKVTPRKKTTTNRRKKAEVNIKSKRRTKTHVGDPVGAALCECPDVASMITLAKRLGVKVPVEKQEAILKLHPGLARMNVGNRIRGFLRREGIDLEAALSRLVNG